MHIKGSFEEGSISTVLVDNILLTSTLPTESDNVTRQLGEIFNLTDNGKCLSYSDAK